MLRYSNMNISFFELSGSEVKIMNVRLEFARKIRLAYNEYCKSLCKEIHMPQTAFDILMFLGNNPECKTARDIVKSGKSKPIWSLSM